MYTSYSTLQRKQLTKQVYTDTQSTYLLVYAPGRHQALEHALENQLHRKFRLVTELAPALTDSVEGVLLVSEPFSNTLFLQAIHMASASNHRLQFLRQENNRMQEKLAQVRLVSRAKCCLIQHEQMTEMEAHRYIEKTAMDTRRDRTEVAQDILDSFDPSGV